MSVMFKLEKVEDANGQTVDTLVKYTQKGSEDPAREEWCTIPELDRLFAACVKRWDGNWDLDKLLIAVAESQID